ncbi:MAG: peptidylprolyl isomerase, partial [Bacteroidales bacterium]|nr:peptidylprolyl isomerase [Bacteroidales bacterium]
MKKILLLSLLMFLLSGLFAQNNVLLTIADKKIDKEEFERIYQKNKKNFSTGEIISVDEYLDLFLKFKLKVIEAEKQGLDTLSSFVDEFNGYRKQLIKPYFIDEECKNKLIKNAYNRLQYEIRAKHILIKLSPDASAEDTAFAYNKISEIRRRIINGEAFEVVAKGTSDDPSVINNGGDLGYFTALQMVYPFEKAAYNLKPGEISNPIRTKFGYHIIQTIDKRKAMGKVKVAHIMLTIPKGMSKEKAKEKEKLIYEIYHKLKEGASFEDFVVQYSEDRGSAKNKGQLPWFGVGRMVKPFEDAAFKLKNPKDISKPIQTSFGWHIIKLLDKKNIGSFDEMKDEIETRIEKDDRIKIAQNKFIEKLKKEYNITEDTSSYLELLDYLTLKNLYSDNTHSLNDILFLVNGISYTKNDFLASIDKIRTNSQLNTITLKKYYNNYLNDILISLEDNNLEEKHPKLRYLLKEYHDGILLFDLTDKLIWTKASEDTVEVRKYFKKNRDNYMWDERYDGVIYFCKNENVCSKVKNLTQKRFLRKEHSSDEILKIFNKK